MKLASALFSMALVSWGQPVETVKVVMGAASRPSRLPAELRPYLKVSVQARVQGFVESVEVDRGSVVKRGQTIARLTAPELAAQIAEARAKVSAAESRKAEAEARRLAAQATFDRLKTASETPGAIAANELIQAEKALDAVKAELKALDAAAAAAEAAVKPLAEIESYLRIEAPFEGTVTERHVHPGALAGPSTGPLVELEQNSRLRLVIAVPEADVAGVARGSALKFRVPAYPGQTFTATVARVAKSLDTATRTMPVEADVNNSNGLLSPGMYADVDWTSKRTRPSLLVPPTAIVTTTERTFVIRVNGGKAEWVNVIRGIASGDLVEVMGALNEGDVIVKRATDEIRDGSPAAAN
jgi:RND family efflux transporter MFP subunit